MTDSTEPSGARIRFHNVSKRYGDVAALADFDLEIGAGEFLTLLGPSGSGKTTALNILAGFTEASGGDVRIDGQSILSLPPEKRNVGMVFQSFALFPHMSVFENVAFPLKLRKTPKPVMRDKVAEALDMVRLGDYAGRRPSELSGGQQQRVALARAVVFQPAVLLMDESLSALDLKLREAMRLEIRHLHSRLGSTIVFVTHDQGEALTLSDRIAVMRDGRIAQIDTPDRVYDQPTTRFVAEFIGQTNLFDVTPADGGGVHVADLGVAIPAEGMNGAKAISLRPEKIRALANGSDAPDAGMVVFDGMVDEPLFLGETVQYSVNLPSGRTMQFRENRGEGRAPLRRNDRVRLAFRPHDAVPIVRD